MSGVAAGFPNANAPFVSPETGVIEPVWRRCLQTIWTRTGGGVGVDSTSTAAQAAAALQAGKNLSDVLSTSAARTNLGLNTAAVEPVSYFCATGTAITVLSVFVAGVQVVGARRTGWVAPTGAVSRASFNAGYAFAPGAIYAQTDAANVATQLAAVSARLGALELDLIAHGIIGT